MCSKKTMMLAAAVLLLPAVSQAQGFGAGVSGLNGELEKLFNQMIPLCSRMIDVGRAIAGFAALWYVGLRAWKHIARAEAIDFYPLLRPFAIGLAIILFPSVINLMNSVLEPTVTATQAMIGDSQDAMKWHLDQEQKALTQPPPAGIYGNNSNQNFDQYAQPDGSSASSGSTGMGSIFDFMGIESAAKALVRTAVQVLYEAAALCINTIRTFYLIVLVILGPIVLGLSVFDGFQQSLASWFARYVHVYMWLPVANIFGAIISKILANMTLYDQNFYSSTTYIVFMIIAILGFTTVPSVAGYIIQPGGKDTLLHKVSSLSGQAGSSGASAAATAAKALI